ncbi:MAG: hypothetical protein OEW35_00690 [Gammaproteobacteria bacterium]|nr:hypothetical protein [Gammaproteobacteria bacterium]MDH4254911.1 hypothetical protein [Gammaproteobacteria bacterium]MDH5309904.1 hypothetical protein [Gammaproteobacteria bacterium]
MKIEDSGAAGLDPDPFINSNGQVVKTAAIPPDPTTTPRSEHAF